MDCSEAKKKPTLGRVSRASARKPAAADSRRGGAEVAELMAATITAITLLSALTIPPLLVALG